MRRSFPFAALLGVAFVLGCQDLAPVGPGGLGPQFAVDCKNKPDHPKCGGDGGGGGGGREIAFELDLAGRMVTTDLPMSGRESNQVDNQNFARDITMHFGGYQKGDCEVIRGTGGVSHAETIEEKFELKLLDLLTETVKRGGFHMGIQLTGLEPGGSEMSTPHHFGVFYDNEFGKSSQIILKNVDGATVRWVSHIEEDGVFTDVFEFRGPVTLGIQGVTGGRGLKSNRTILCGVRGEDPDNLVTATITWPAA